MIRKLMQHRAIRLLGLMAVTPLLIGHGLGCLFDCDEQDVNQKNYVISGSANPGSSINIGFNIKIMAGNISYTSPASAAGGSVPPIEYTTFASHRIFATVNDAPGGSAIGEMWVHSNGKSIKLIHPAAGASYLNASFDINDQEFDLPQSSTIAGTSNYTLSGGSTGSEVLNLLTPVVIYVNNQIIYTRVVTDNNIRPPIVFQAAPGDELRILAGGTNPSVLLSSIWLHTPNGNGIKLSHGVMNRSTDSAGVFLDVVYVLQ